MESYGRLHRKTALITGTSSGLGRAIAFAYASQGANICCVDLYPAPRNAIDAVTGKADSYHNRVTSSALNPATHEALISENGLERLDGHDGPRFIFLSADMTVSSDVESVIEECVKVFGRLDIIVNNAGISVESTHSRLKRLHETSESDYDSTMNINVRGDFLECKYALAQMLQQDPLPGEKDRGWVLNTASVQGLVGYLGTPSYCASKGAVVALTRQIALDYAPDRIHCNALCPGFLSTAMTQNLKSDPEVYQSIGRAHPFGGIGDPHDVARAAVFLVSRDAAWITGVPLPVDGGYTAQ